jgi:hypothetical protein
MTVPLADFVKRFSKFTEDDLLSLEFTLAQSLKFEFSVWHGHKALRGFMLDLQVSSLSSRLAVGHVYPLTFCVPLFLMPSSRYHQ